MGVVQRKSLVRPIGGEKERCLFPFSLPPLKPSVDRTTFTDTTPDYPGTVSRGMPDTGFASPGLAVEL